MGFDVFTKNAGFERYYGLNEYPYPEDFDGNWGVFDEPFLQFFCNELNSYPQPFLSSVFTISSHQPYKIPKKYKGRFPKGKLDIHESIGYTDHSLREFFNKAKKQDWYENTLFIITGDHTQMNYEKAYKNVIGDFNVPLLIFHPKNKFHTMDTIKISQHTDIMPTVLDYLDIIQICHIVSSTLIIFWRWFPAGLPNYMTSEMIKSSENLCQTSRRSATNMKCSLKPTYNTSTMALMRITGTPLIEL
jgi:uncharacterized sulfatase